MNREVAPGGGHLPTARTRERKWTFPFIWLVPVAAAVVAGYLVYQRVHEFGPTLTIQFRDVSGVKPGQTPVQYRGAEIGHVTSVGLSKDQQHAMVKVKLRRSVAALAREGSAFWIVRPQLGMGDFTGLGTIITGPYIEVSPGDGKAASEFTGREHSPAMLDPSGLNVVLLSDHGGSLRAGVPIYYRGIEVGAVQKTQLGSDASVVEIHGVIRRAYAPLVRADSKFWNVTGLDVRVGLFRGAELNVESLKALLIGGIAFATPEGTNGGPTPDGMVFRLYDQAESEWTEWTPQIAITPDDPAPGQSEADATRKLRLPQGHPP